MECVCGAQRTLESPTLRGYGLTRFAFLARAAVHTAVCGGRQPATSSVQSGHSASCVLPLGSPRGRLPHANGPACDVTQHTSRVRMSGVTRTVARDAGSERGAGAAVIRCYR